MGALVQKISFNFLILIVFCIQLQFQNSFAQSEIGSEERSSYQKEASTEAKPMVLKAGLWNFLLGKFFSRFLRSSKNCDSLEFVEEVIKYDFGEVLRATISIDENIKHQLYTSEYGSWTIIEINKKTGRACYNNSGTMSSFQMEEFIKYIGVET